MLNSWGTANGKRPHSTFRMRMNIDYNGAYGGGYPILATEWEKASVKFNCTPRLSYTITTIPTIMPTTVTPTPVTVMATLKLSLAVTTARSGTEISLDLELSNVEDEVWVYTIRVRSDNPAVVMITSAVLPARAGLTSVSTLPSSTVTLRGTDLFDQMGGRMENISLGRLMVRGGEAGTARLTVTVTRRADDEVIPVLVTTEPAVIMVETSVPSGVIRVFPATILPTDPDQERIYEDLNGNGRVDFNDILLLLRRI